ncbi:protein TolQ [Sandaracinobacteroides hominis]|uniref:protein TolQ n=1 Tax=Sandaracinobacteroides hominis TaxID=2780086 RepID=UPI001F2F3DAE|nr:protein TolQ [Sandaracinobacteroides hominis]
MLKTAETMSPWALFLQADIVVKAVMIGLLLASVWSWAIIFERTRRLKQIDREAAAFEEKFWKAKTLDELDAVKGQHPTADLFRAGMDEWQASVEGRANVDREGVRARLGNVMAASIDRSVSDLSDRLNVLATIGSVAPFVGLFGTVWGIMRAFIAIGVTQNTSLAVVAPGIAEALFATAIGLFAAIPAVIGYNRLLHRITRLEDRLQGFSSAFHALMSRELDGVS